jgi:hypothetical protein
MKPAAARAINSEDISLVYGRSGGLMQRFDFKLDFFVCERRRQPAAISF